jgi:hypothetical protein
MHVATGREGVVGICEMIVVVVVFVLLRVQTSLVGVLLLFVVLLLDLAP